MTKSGICYLILCGLLTGCVTTTNSDQVTISSSDSELIFYPPESSELRPIGVHTRRTTPNLSSTTFSGFWRGEYHGAFPHARFFYRKLSPGWYLRADSADVVGDYVSKNLKFGKVGEVTPGRASVQKNELGDVNIRRFKVAETQCFAFEQSWGIGYSTAVEAGSNRIIGYYCSGNPREISKEFVANFVSACGTRDDYQPPQPEKWAERLSKAGGGNVGAFELKVVLDWEGQFAGVSGRLSATNPNANEGKLFTQLPSNRGECSGKWRYLGGKFETDQLPNGSWSMLCTNGLSAKGTYSYVTKTLAKGEGVDADGKSIRFSFRR